MRRQAASAGGFTLVEVLLAFIVFALSFAVVLEIIASSARATMRARDDTEVALVVQSVIDGVGVEIPVEPGSWAGTQLDRYEWTLVINEYLDTSQREDILELAEIAGTVLYRLDLEVRWQAGTRERVETFTTYRGRLAGVNR